MDATLFKVGGEPWNSFWPKIEILSSNHLDFMAKITKLPRILDQNRPITRYFWIQSPNTKNTRPPPFWQSIIVELITKHRCRSALASTTMLSKFNNDALYSKQSIVVVKVYGPYNSCHCQYGGLQIHLSELYQVRECIEMCRNAKEYTGMYAQPMECHGM